MSWGKTARVTLNGTDITEHIDREVRSMFAKKLELKFDADFRAAMTPPNTVGLQPFSGSFHMAFVRVRPTADVRACLWRRNLDGGVWRKRGHVTHRGAGAGRTDVL